MVVTDCYSLFFIISMSSKQATDEFKVVCSKDQMVLRKHKTQNLFCLEFGCKNDNFNLTSFITFKIFDLVFELNRDVLDAIKPMKQISDTEYEYIYLFKNLNEDLGMKKKYMYVNKTISYNDSGREIVITSKSVPFDGHADMVTNGYDVMETSLSVQKFVCTDNHTMRVLHMFKINIVDDLPVYMENTIGIVIKKIYHRFKMFIESMS